MLAAKIILIGFLVLIGLTVVEIVMAAFGKKQTGHCDSDAGPGD